MNLIEQLEKLPRTHMYNHERQDGSDEAVCTYVKLSDLRAIIEQAKREAVEPVAVPAGYKLVPVEYVESAEDVLEKAPCDCSHKRRYENGDHYSGCHLFDLNIASIALSAAPESPQPDHTKLIGELVKIIELLESDPYAASFQSMAQYRKALLTKAREAVRHE